MLWGIAKPKKMMDFQAQAFRPSEDHGFKLVPDAPIVVSHLDTSSYSASQKQCVFQYGEFYGSFWLGMLCMMAFARSPATERAVCITCFIYMAFVSNATWYQQANFFEGNLSFVFFDLLQGAIFLLLAFVVPNQTAEVKPLAKPLLEGGA